MLSQVFNVEEWFRPGLEGPGVLFELIDVIRERQLTMPKTPITTTCSVKVWIKSSKDRRGKRRGHHRRKNREKTEVVYEAADLIYHLLVLLVEQGVELSDVLPKLRSRR